MNELIKTLQKRLHDNFTVTALKLLITAWAAIIVTLSWFIDNGWLLAGILAYEVLP